MTRKRISDLLREEAGNGSLTPPPTTIEAEVKAVTAPAQPDPAPVLESPAAPHPLAEEVQALKAALEAAQQEAIAKAAALAEAQEQVTTLKSELNKTKGYQKELESQKDLIGKLYGELQRENPLQSELEEQKALIESLYAEIEQLKQSTVTKTAIAKSPLSPTAAIARTRPSAQQSALANLPVYRPIPRPIGKTLPGQDPKKAKENDVIGWFD